MRLYLNLDVYISLGKGCHDTSHAMQHIFLHQHGEGIGLRGWALESFTGRSVQLIGRT